MLHSAAGSINDLTSSRFEPLDLLIQEQMY